MLILKSSLIDPNQNSILTVPAISLSVFIFAYSFIFGPIAILIYFACWFPFLALEYKRVISTMVFSPVLVGFIFFAVLSVLWSQFPNATARSSIQLASHFLCVVIAVNVASRRSFSLGLMLGALLVLLFSLVFGRSSYDPIDGSYTFVGMFGSKNQLGFYASLGILFSIYTLSFLSTSRVVKCVAIFTILLGCYLLFASKSATSWISLFAALALFLTLCFLRAFSQYKRTVMIAIGLIFAIGLLVIAIQIDLYGMVLGLLGKDTTLTGRTYLWETGLTAAADAYLTGIGYQAFWVRGYSEAERLWAEFYIPNRQGFHFHNTYIELIVSLGYIGCALVVWVILSTYLKFIPKILQKDLSAYTILAFSLLSMLIIRSFAEVDVISAYAIGSFLLYFISLDMNIRRI